MAKLVIFFSLLIYSSLLMADCNSKNGIEKERCTCFELMLSPMQQEFNCSKDDDCDYLRNLCGDYTAINRKFLDKYKKLYEMPIMDLKAAYAPEKSVCEKNFCIMVYKK